jgi:diguanylate cyclase (GGDEF)-like protein
VAKRKITYRELLDGILPVSKLPFKDRFEIQKALENSDEAALQDLTVSVAGKLELQGFLRKISEEKSSTETVLKYRNLLTAESVTIRVLGKKDEEDGLVKKIAPPFPWRESRTTVHQMKQIIAMDDRLLSRDEKLLSGPAEVLHLVVRTTPDILGCDRACFFFSKEAEAHSAVASVGAPDQSYFLDQAERWVIRDGFIVHIPDLEAYFERNPVSTPPAYGSMAMARVGNSSPLAGVLQTWSKEKHFFDDDRLALLEIIAHNCGLLLNRYSRLEKLVFRDSLTGVYNRSYFYIQLSNETARAEREGSSLALSIVDIDDFKTFNERYGYEGGNAVLSGLAATLSENVRPFDSVARWGGEEFAVVLSSPVVEHDAFTICERLRSTIENSTYTITALDGSRHQVSVTASSGSAIYPVDAQDSKDLWKKAELALKWAKRHGKNRTVFWSAVRGEADK